MRKISPEGIVILLICIADLVLTIIVVRSYGAQEGNPLMAYYLKKGTGAFILAKAVMTMVPLFVLELARQRHPHFVRNCMRGCACAYIVMYAAGVAHLNTLSADDRHYEAVAAWAESIPDPNYIRSLPHRPHYPAGSVVIPVSTGAALEGI